MSSRVSLKSTRSAIDQVQSGQPASSTRVIDLPPETIAPNPDNPRATLPATDELAESMKAEGQLEPSIVMARTEYLARNPDAASSIKDCDWVVLWGSRRREAAEKAGLPLQCIVFSATDVDLTDIYVRSAIENLEREGLRPSEEAHLCARLKEALKTQSAVAKRLRRTEGWVSYRLRLCELIPELLEQVDSRTLKIEEGRDLAKLTPELQSKVAAEEIPVRLGQEISRLPGEEQAKGLDERLNGVKSEGHAQEDAPPADLHGVKARDAVPAPSGSSPTPQGAETDRSALRSEPNLHGVKADNAAPTPAPAAEQLMLDLQWEPRTMAERLHRELGDTRFNELMDAGIELTTR